MVRPYENSKGIFTLPKEYASVITQLIAQGQADLTNVSPKLRSSLGRTAQTTGLFRFKKICLIESIGEIDVICTTDRIIKVKKKE